MIRYSSRSLPGSRIRAPKSALARLLCLSLILLLLWPALGVFAAEETPVEQAQHGVVRVACDLGESWWSTGTGFAVGAPDDAAQIFITNNHVVEEAPDACYITITDIYGLIPAEVLYRDPAVDLAVLRIATPLSDRHPLPLLSPKELHKSQDVFCLGFPGVMDNFSDTGDSMPSGIGDITITKGTVSNPSYVAKGVTCIATDAVVNGGNSGGPMTDEYGQVVGVNAWGVEDNMNFAISIDHVIDVLNDLGLAYTAGVAGGVPAATEAPSATEAPTTTEAPSVPATTEAPGESPAAGAPAGKWVLIAVGAVLLIGGLVCLLLLGGKKKTDVISPPPPPPPEYWYCEKCGRRNDRSCTRCPCETEPEPRPEPRIEREPEREAEKVPVTLGLKAFRAEASTPAVSHTPVAMHGGAEPSRDSGSPDAVTEKPAVVGLKKSSFGRPAEESGTAAAPSKPAGAGLKKSSFARPAAERAAEAEPSKPKPSAFDRPDIL